MQPRNNEFVRPASPPTQVPITAPVNLTKQVIGNLFVKTQYDSKNPSKKVIHVTNYSLTNGLPSDNLPEESCDSTTDFDNDDVSMSCDGPAGLAEKQPSNFLQALKQVIGNDGTIPETAIKNEQVDPSAPYHVPSSRYQTVAADSTEIPAHKELQILMKEVDGSKPSSPEMAEDRVIIDKLLAEVPKLEMVEEPENVSLLLLPSIGNVCHYLFDTTETRFNLATCVKPFLRGLVCLFSGHCRTQYCKADVKKISCLQEKGETNILCVFDL